MGQIILAILRPVFIWVVQQGATLAVFAVLEKILDAIQEWVRDTFSISETDSRAIVANYAIDALAYIGTGAAIIYSKAPVTLARKLGLSGGKPVKQTVTVAATTKVEKTAVDVAVKAGTSLFKKVALIVAGLSTLSWLGIGFANVLEQGVYQPRQANDTWEKYTSFRPFPEGDPLDSPGPFTRGEFEDYLRGLESAGVLGIEAPYGSYLFNKETLGKLIDYVAGQESVKGKTTTTKSIIPLLSQYLVTPDKPKTTTVTPPKTTTTTPTLTVPKVQVFTGVLSQGVLGKGLEFSARPDDLIENAQEMLDAASNNLAPFISALPSRITYQVRVVNSITTKDGFTQKGNVQQIITGYSTSGAPKYKTVVNKFAVLDIYVLNDKKARVKIDTIILGPVDSVKFQVAQGTLTLIQDGLTKVATTSNIGAIKGIETTGAVTVTTPPSQIINNQTPPPVPSIPTPAPVSNKPIGHRPSFNAPDGTSVWTADDGNFYDSNGAPLYQDPKNPNKFASTPFTPAPPVAPTSSTPKLGASANTLSEWYTANGKAMPSLAERAQLYQQYGLGQSAYYAGTAEQNTNLLNKLKSL